MHLVRWDDGDEPQPFAHVVAKAARQLALGRERAHGGAKERGCNVIGVSLERGRHGDELLARHGAARERGRAHDARDHARRAGTQAAGNGNLGLDVNRDGEGLHAPLLKCLFKGNVDHVVAVLELFRAAGDCERIGMVESEVGIERDRHAERVVANAEVCARCGNGNFDHAKLPLS